MKYFALIAILTAASAMTMSASIVQFENRGLWQTAAGSVSATTDFTGVVEDNADLYLQNPLTLNDMTFSGVDGFAWVIGPDVTTVHPGLYDWGSGPVGVYTDGGHLKIDFAQPVLAFGMEFGAFGLEPGNVIWGGEATITLPDGSVASRAAETAQRLRFLGLISDTPFSSVTLSGSGAVVFDNVSVASAPPVNAVPEPGTLALVGGALMGVGVVRRRA